MALLYINPIFLNKVALHTHAYSQEPTLTLDSTKVKNISIILNNPLLGVNIKYQFCGIYSILIQFP